MIYPNTIFSVSVYDYALVNRYIINAAIMKFSDEFTYFQDNCNIQNYKQICALQIKIARNEYCESLD